MGAENAYGDIALESQGDARMIHREPPAHPEVSLGGQLTETERRILREEGFNPDEVPDCSRFGPEAAAAAQLAHLLDTSLDVKDTAELLGVGRSRLRQRLSERTLYGIKLGNQWRLPQFQFEGGILIPGFDIVVPCLPPTMHPVAVHRWFTRPCPDLYVEGIEENLCPLQWLALGNDPGIVARIAAHL